MVKTLLKQIGEYKRDTIIYGRLEATDEECIAAAKLANADSFIRRLSDGYQTVLTGDGANLSQGQRQLIEEKGRYYQLYTGNAIA